jgi:Ca-activated chloride channel family protein
MEYNDSMYVAEICEKQQAQHLYDSVAAAGGNASLLVQKMPNIFQQRLANIGFGDSAYVRIEVSMPLKYDNGVFELAVPTMVAERYQSGLAKKAQDSPWNPPEDINGQRLQFNVLVKTGYPVTGLQSPTHPIGISDLAASRSVMEQRGLLEPGEVAGVGFHNCALLLSQDTYPNRDYVLRFERESSSQDFSVATYMDAQRKSGFFALSLYPDPTLLSGDRPGLEVVLLVDISGSQGGWPIQKEKEISNMILGALLPTDRLSVLAFNTTVF